MTPSQAIGEAPTSADTSQPIGDAAASGGTSPGSRAAALPPRYALGQQLGAGGMGEVLLARDDQIGRDVAIKRMRVAATPVAVTRFLREAKIQGRLEHPSIVPVHELASDAAGRPFFVMKRLSGTTLAAILKDASMSRQKLLRAFADVCLAIEFAHRRGVIHRDLKPDNIMLGDFGEVYVLDWGIAHVDTETDSLHDGNVTAGEEGTTEAGAILGTPGYIAPELIGGESIDTRADVYALGAILFEILAGQTLLPRGRAALQAAASDVESRPSVRAPDRECPPELDAICVAATSRARDDRPSARELAERIERYLDGDRDLALRKTLAASHLAAAREALDTGDGEAERAHAMREAGRAIALDPRDPAAAELVGRLMLEPPREIPREVDERVAKIEEETARGKVRTMAWVLPAFLAVIPAALLIGLRNPMSILWVGGAIAINLALTWFVAARKRAPQGADLQRAALVFSVLVFVIAREFSPFMLAPSIAAVSVILFVVDPRVPWLGIVASQLLAVLAPWLLELAGVLPRTLHELNGELVVHSDMIRTIEPQTDIGVAVFVVFTVLAAGLVARQVGVAQRQAVRTTELQAWHLRQLVRRA